MGLIVKGKTAGTEYDFIPDVLGNKETAEPMSVRVKVPTRRVMRRLIALMADEDPVKIMDAMHLLCGAVVLKVSNYTTADGKSIVTGEDLTEHGDDEVLQAISIQIQEDTGYTEQEKN